MQKLSLAVVLIGLLIGAGVACGQTDVVDEDLLSNSADVNLFYAEQRQRYWRDNADRLVAIDQEYKTALKALSAENVARLQAILTANSEAHKSMSEDASDGLDRASETQRIQTESTQSRAELRSWYDAEREAISERHKAQRAAQLAATQTQVLQLNEQQKTTLQRVLAAPVPLRALDQLPTRSDVPAVPVVGATAVAGTPGVPGATDDDLLAGELSRIETPPGVEPAPERPRDPRLEPPECVWGECPDYAAWGDEPPTDMVCKEMNSGEFDERVYAKMTERIRGTEVHINADESAGEMSYIKVRGKKLWGLNLNQLRREHERSLNESRYKLYVFQDINSTLVRVFDETRRHATSGYVIQIDFESDRAELKGYCPGCRSWRRDSSVADAHYGSGKNSKGVWSWAYRFEMISQFSPDGGGNIGLMLSKIELLPHPGPEKPSWDIRHTRPNVKDFAQRAIRELENYVGVTIAVEAFGRLPAEVLTEMTGIPRDRLYYVAHTEPEWERGSDDIWRVCYRET